MQNYSNPDVADIDWERNYPLREKGFRWPKSSKRKIKIVGAYFPIVSILLVSALFYIASKVLEMARNIWRSNGQIKSMPQQYSSLSPSGDSKRSNPRVCIIGAGASGLVSAKELLAEGARVTVLEKEEELGGAFKIAYKEGYLTSSKIMTEFSDYPFRGDRKGHWKFSEYTQYLESYACHFSIFGHIKFHSEIIDTELSNNIWKVKYKNNLTEQIVEEEFDSIIVCAGINHIPKVPKFKGESSFRGKIIHSSSLRSIDCLSDKKVLVLGIGESGSDLSLYAAERTESLTIVGRSGPGYVVPRYYCGTSSDVDSTALYYSLSRSFFAGKVDHSKSPPLPFWWKIKGKISNLFANNFDFFIQEIDSKTNYTRYHWMNRYGTKSTNFLSAIDRYGAKFIEQNIAYLTDNHVVFDDGTISKCDVIVCCSGFQRKFDYLPSTLQNVNYRRDLWLKIFHPDFGKKIAFIGYSRPAIGAIPPIAELQARLVAKVLTSQLKLPKKKNLELSIESDCHEEAQSFVYDSNRLGGLCDYYPTLTKLANQIGCNPKINIFSAIKQPILTYRILAGPLIAARWRLSGPGLELAIAKKSINEAPITPLLVNLYLCSLHLIEKGISLHSSPRQC